MNFPSVFSIISAFAALCLSVWLVILSIANASSASGLQILQEEVMGRQQAVQNQQQQLQAQQQQIDSGAQLAQQVGPAVLKDLAAVQVQNKNIRIAELLKKHGLEVKENPAPTNR